MMTITGCFGPDCHNKATFLSQSTLDYVIFNSVLPPKG